MRRIVSVWLPRWPILRFLTAQGSSASIAPDQPFVLTVDGSGGPRIAATSPAAEHDGLFIGQTLSDARAKAGGLLQVHALEPERDAQALRRLTLWATRYTPAASPWGLENGGDGFFLDITGSSHLFGGEDALLRDLIKRLKTFNLTARCAIAGTPGAAWALSHASSRLPLCLADGQEKEALRPLSIKALRLGPDSYAALRRLGFKTIGMLIDAPRAPFAARFENELLLRLDQALGLRREALHFISPPPVYHVQHSFLDPIFAQETVVATAAKLMQRLIPSLTQDGVGIRGFRLDLYRVDGDVQQIEIGMAAPTRDPSHIARLLTLKLDRLDRGLETGFGFDCVRLSVTLAEKTPEWQGDLETPANTETSAEQQARLIDALKQRLGPEAVRQLQPVESHIPERAEISQKADGPAPSWPTPDADRSRPPLLLPQPEETRVTALIPDGPPRQFQWRGETHIVTSAQGPERIADEWWRSDAKGFTRDYFCLENTVGQRFWLYREGLYGRETSDPRWFVHGFFA
ncbi:Y-family DNA polymerase [Taklimakanibacter deserti]|uniref:Y-family DNA polymerase n=1 Tax=Taklimakanibacter deserti TaxID=2267839 RepID=UPI000E64D530